MSEEQVVDTNVIFDIYKLGIPIGDEELHNWDHNGEYITRLTSNIRNTFHNDRLEL